MAGIEVALGTGNQKTEKGQVNELVGRSEVKEILDARITDAIYELIKEHNLHPQEAALVLIDQAQYALDALSWSPQAVLAAKKMLKDAANLLAY